MATGKVIDLSIGFNNTTIGFNFVEQNYTNLSAIVGTAIGQLAYVQDSEGTQWLPAGLGGTYYPNGIYIWDGVNWISDRNAIAEQLDVNIDDITQLETDLSNEITNRTNADLVLQGFIDANETATINNANAIAVNSNAISTNTTNISTNATNISNNTSSIGTLGTDISNNTSAINTNTTDIGTNATAIGVNTTNISTNTTNIGNNTTNIGTNASDITNLQNTKLDSVVGGTNISVDNTDPLNPIVNYDGNTAPKIKSGLVLAASFTGNPKKTSAITFATPFASANYSIVLTAHTQNNTTFSIDYESRLAGSFVINTHANNINNLIDVTWIATEIGEN